MTKNVDFRVYGILDPEHTAQRDPVVMASRAVDGGITCLQLRDKRADEAARMDLAGRVKQALNGSGVPLIINDHVEVAKQVAADGVHLGRSDTDAVQARVMLGADAIVGVTIHHGEEAETLGPNIADYAGLGPVYLTATKDPGDPPLGPFGLERLIRNLRSNHGNMPCVGIAGITHKNAAPVIQAGADGIAVIGNIFKADDVTAAARRLREIVDLEFEKMVAA